MNVEGIDPVEREKLMKQDMKGESAKVIALGESRMIANEPVECFTLHTSIVVGNSEYTHTDPDNDQVW